MVNDDDAIRDALRELEDDLLLRHHAGVLDDAARREVDARLARSPELRERLELLEPLEPATDPLERAVRWVFAVAENALVFVRGATAPIEPPATAWATRSGAAAPPVFAELRHDLATLRVEHLGKGAVDLEVTVPSRARVTLRRVGRTLDSVTADRAALFRRLAPAAYEIEIAGAVLRLDLVSP